MDFITMIIPGLLCFFFLPSALAQYKHIKQRNSIFHVNI